MSIDLIKTIIRGKKVTGDDVGRLLLADMAEEYKNFLNTGEVKSVITQDEFNKLLNSLQGDYNLDRYNRYVNIHNTIKTYMSMTRGTAGEISSRLELLIRILGHIKTTIQTETTKASMPLILTQKEYDNLIRKYVEPIKNTEYTYISIFLHFIDTQIDQYINARENTPEETSIDKEVEALIDLYKDKPVKNPELRRLYNSMYSTSGEDGYFMLTCSENVGDTREEFIHKLALRNVVISEDILANYSTKDLKKPVDERFIRDILTPEQISSNLHYELYSKAPETVYKTDLLNSNIFTDTHLDKYAEDKEGQKEVLEVLALYLKELPELEEFIKGRMSKYKCLKAVVGTKLKDFYKVKLKGETLLEENVPDYRSWANYQLREEYYRAYNGVAIIKEDILDKYNKEYIIDENGNYKKSNENSGYNNLVEDAYLDTIIQLGKDNKNMLQALYSNMKQLYAHNAFIEMIANIINVPVLKEAFIYDTEAIESNVEEYNRLLYILLVLKLPDYGSKGFYKRAMEIRENVFKALPYIDLKKAEVTPEAKEQALNFMKDLNNFRGITATSRPFYILTGWSK